MQSLATMIRI